eukprot:gnl/MRDRNA2_/MRDRNA2_93631_c0_seq1.p1 gnl/MRDRNA2_/MRDRNA2_93631_c0~~gnl/MRDRNA2_/MRDRNA2_93631_c0_seq1.p1  ORF type:complete len:657 (+),score=142.75 gnl/MRDRNA2_/MRDRNA2_93631_c0_seq1:92-2062(+)
MMQMEPLTVMIPESLHAASGPSSGYCSPSRPLMGRSISRDVLLLARPSKIGDGWGISAKKISTDGITAEGALRNLDGETPSREALLAIRSALGVNRRQDGEQVLERTALVCPLQIRFSQLAMKPSFKESEMEVKNTVSQITLKKHEERDLLVCPFAPIRCIWWKPRDGDKAAWFSLDNRRLVALQKRALQCEDPSRCLAEVIVLDRLPDPALVRERGFHGEGHGIDILGEESWDWRVVYGAKFAKNDSSESDKGKLVAAAKIAKNESSDEGSTDSGDETGSITGESSSDARCDEDAPSPLSLTGTSHHSSSPAKSPAARISLEAALYTASSPGAHNEPPPAPWWWPAPQFDAPEVKDSPEDEAKHGLLLCETHPGLGGVQPVAASERTKLNAPPGLDLSNSNTPKKISAPPNFDATSIELVSSGTIGNDDGPAPPAWSAEILTQPCSPGGAPTWWPTSTEGTVADSTPPPPTWWADGDAVDQDAAVALSPSPSPSFPPPPAAPAEMNDSTPPPPSYNAPGFDAPQYDAPGFDPSDVVAPPAVPPNVAAPPIDPPKLVVSLETLSDPKTPPSAPPKQLPKLTVSLEELTSTNAQGNINTPSMAPPPAYMAPGFVPQHWNGMQSPCYTPQSAYSAPYSPMRGSFASPAAGVPSKWGCF